VTNRQEGFVGFGPDALTFYEGLAVDNSKAYWQAHKHVYERDVSGPLQALAEELAEEFGSAKTFRPYRDVRFSADKRPYKENAALVVQDGGALYASLSLEGLFVAAGYYQPSRDQLERFRALQDDERVTADLDRLLARLAKRGYPLGEGDPVRTAPRGYSKDHPRIELLRRRTLTVSAHHEPGQWLHTRECLDVIRDGWRTCRAWNTWLEKNVGPSVDAQQR
jgi:uncharacterized protein (TIGR02453 family)